ncbi:hypothetical protein [Aneurinibacillus terranovensis]|uniref:hypothetical protein n=1 Tax=Aneurinibacillus terranovensis TaxID=278991 RepID=UPI00041D0998|nr:hypothetical protein [Aneurinibacillus terranovensis]
METNNIVQFPVNGQSGKTQEEDKAVLQSTLVTYPGTNVSRETIRPILLLPPNSNPQEYILYRLNNAKSDYNDDQNGISRTDTEHDKIVSDEITAIKSAINELQNTMYQMASGGGGGGMDDLKERVQNLERSVDDIKNQLKDKPSTGDLNNAKNELKIEMLTMKSDIKSELSAFKSDVLQAFHQIEQKIPLKIADENFVEKKISDAKLQQIFWIVGTGIAIAGVIIRFLK